MKHEVPRILKTLINQYGFGLCEKPKRCRALLLDYCGEFKREINALDMALQKGVPAALQSSPKAALNLTQERLAKKMFNELGLVEDISYWAVQAWSYALGLSDEEPKPLWLEKKNEKNNNLPKTPVEQQVKNRAKQNYKIKEQLSDKPIASITEEVFKKPERLSILRGHQYPVLSLAFSPDGQQLASSGQDYTARLWDTSTYSEIATLRGHKGYVESVAFSPDSKKLATASGDYAVKLWDTSTKQELSTFRSHGAWVFSAAFSPDGKLLASGSWNKTIRIWNTFSRIKQLVLRGHKSWVLAISFSPNGKTLASASKDQTIRLWDYHTGKETMLLQGHNKEIYTIVFSPDSKILASAGKDSSIRLWDVTTGKQLRVLTGHKMAVTALAFSPDGKILASGSKDHTVKFWDPFSGKEFYTQTDHNQAVYAIAFSPDNRIFASAGDDHTIELWLNHPLVKKISTAGKAAIPEKTDLASVGQNGSEFESNDLPDSATIRNGKAQEAFFDKKDHADSNALLEKEPHELSVLRGHKDWVWTVAFSPDGKTLASGSLDKTIRLWDLSTIINKPILHGLDDTFKGKRGLELEGHKKPVFSVAFSPDGETMASGSLDNTVRIWNLPIVKKKAISSGQQQSPKYKQTLELKGHKKPVFSVAFSPNGKTLASGSLDKTIRLWDVHSGKTFKVIGGPKVIESEILSVAFSPKDKILASGDSNCTIQMWDTISYNEIWTFKGHKDWVSSVAFSPDGKLLASASYDRTVRLWDTTSQVEVLVLLGHENKVHSVSFSPFGKILATGSLDKTIRLWDTETGSQIAVLVGHSDYVVPVAFSPNGILLASGSYDKTVRIWNIPSGERMSYMV